MKFKSSKLIIIISIITCLLISLNIMAQEEEFVDPDIPDSWYEKPQVASEVGVTEFNQSPIFDEEVKEGKLPPVQQRLPEDPIVIENYEEIGKYGGIINAWDRTLNYYELTYWNSVRGVRETPDGFVKPWILEDWEYSNDYQDLTIYLRKDLKWSDGEPFNADDYMYWWEYEANNEDLEPTPPEKWNPSLLDVEKVDEWTVTFKYGRAVPFQHRQTFRWNLGSPSHYMKQFHPDFIGEDKAQKFADETGLDEWHEYYNRILDDSPTHPEYEYSRPVLSPYVAEERSETTLLMKRNPYYFVVDSEGNQLPYIEKIRINLANDPEMAASKAVTGEATFAGRHLQTEDIPLYKKYEEREDYRTLLYYRPYGTEAGIQLNLTHEDSKLRDIFQNVNFRRALSYGIDRENINNKVYYGRATEMQATYPPINEVYEEEFAQAYAEYKPEEAEKLLEEMGMLDVNGDGYRETPDGKTFNPTFMYTKIGPIDPTSILELVQGQWEDIGINIDLKMVSRELYNTRIEANNFDIGCWTLDEVLGESGNSVVGLRHFAPIFAPWVAPWPAWVHWYNTDGETGMEPPAEIKKLIEYAETVAYGTDDEARFQAKKKLAKAQAENLWYIGTVGMAPQPIIVNENLKNIPEKGLWDASITYLSPYHSEQMYLDTE